MAAPGGGTPSVDHRREPCPDRILDDVGGAFGMGAVGGGIWHALKGAKNSPGGVRTRGALEVSVQRADVGGAKAGKTRGRARRLPACCSARRAGLVPATRALPLGPAPDAHSPCSLHACGPRFWGQRRLGAAKNEPPLFLCCQRPPCRA